MDQRPSSNSVSTISKGNFKDHTNVNDGNFNIKVTKMNGLQSKLSAPLTYGKLN
jgi:hypothetical protein